MHYKLILAIILCISNYTNARHYLLYSKPAYEMQKINSYYASKHLCSIDFVNLQLRNTTNTNNTDYPIYMHAELFTD